MKTTARKALLAGMLALSGFASAEATAFEVDGIKYTITSEDDRTVSVKYYYKSSTNAKYYIGDVVIPSTVTYVPDGESTGTTYSVTGISDYAFYYCNKLTSIDIPASVTSIGNHAFFSCKSLVTVTVPEGIQKIEDATFEGCYSLESVTLPGTVTSIGDGAFGACYNLTSIVLPGSLKSIGESAFCQATSLESLDIPSTVTRIGEDAFSECSSLKSIVIPDGVTEIGRWTFWRCHSLESVTIGSGVTSIADYAFDDCNSLVKVASLNASPPKCYLYVFHGVDTDTCILYVPQGSRSLYGGASQWSDFVNIVEIDPAGIEVTTAENEAVESGRWTLDGCAVTSPARGVNIVRYSDGTVKKVVGK